MSKTRFCEFWHKTFGPDGLFSSGAEGHAFLIGICEVVAFTRARYDMPADYQADGKPLTAEYHYYSFGRAMGVILWIVLIIYWIAPAIKHLIGE